MKEWAKNCMQIHDVSCPHCRSLYKVAISDSVEGKPGQYQCQVCARIVDQWDDLKHRVYRMIPPAGHGHLHVTTVPPPIV